MIVYLVSAVALLALDALTFTMLPAGAEANPLVAPLPVLVALALKGVVIALMLAAADLLTRTRRYVVRDVLLVVAIAAGGVGLGSNLAVIMPALR